MTIHRSGDLDYYTAGKPTWTKRTGETRLLAFNFAPRMAPGEDLDSVTSITPTSVGRVAGSAGADITISTQSTSGSDLEFYASGGTDGEIYKLTMTVVAGSETIIGVGYLVVNDE